MCDMAMLRVYKQSDLEEFAKFASIPVINGLSDDFHPVQLMADYMTMDELSSGNSVAYVGDGNNMCHSWLMLASKLGLDLRIATPDTNKPNDEVVKIALENAKLSGATITLSNDPRKAVENADVVTTDTWVSMGEEAGKQEKLAKFSGYCVDDEMMSLANKNAIFLHCLPAYRDYEVSESVFEAHAKEVFLEAENRLHAQKGVMVWLDRNRK